MVCRSETEHGSSSGFGKHIPIFNGAVNKTYACISRPQKLFTENGNVEQGGAKNLLLIWKNYPPCDGKPLRVVNSIAQGNLAWISENSELDHRPNVQYPSWGSPIILGFTTNNHIFPWYGFPEYVVRSKPYFLNQKPSALGFHEGIGTALSSVRAFLSCLSRGKRDSSCFRPRLSSLFSLPVHSVGLPFDGSPSGSQKSGLPDHLPNLQQTNYNQKPCEPFELPLYGEICAALLASLIAIWGGWLWGGGNRIWGGLLAVFGLGLLASALTAVGFCDPLFWRAEWRSLTFQEANRCGCQQSEYHQAFEHDGENVSHKTIDAGWASMRVFPYMESSVTFSRYYGGFVRRLAKDATPWARDNIGFAGFMVIAPIAAVYAKDHNHSIDWDVVKTTGWIYLVAAGVYLAYHAIRTSWKLDQDRVAALAHEEIARLAAEDEVRRLTEKPDLRKESLFLSESILDFIHDRLENAPEMPFRAMDFTNPSPLHQILETGHHQAVVKRYEAETLEIYNYRFMRKVVEAVKRFDGVNLAMDTPPGFWSDPSDCGDVKMIGQALARLADELPN